jgi:threonine/homoserine/homoserine lactone efflux protein
VFAFLLVAVLLIVWTVATALALAAPLVAWRPAFDALRLLFGAMTFAWLAACAAVVARAGEAILRPRVRRALDAVTGLVLVAFGVRLAGERS